jgi:hypothetical protein
MYIATAGETWDIVALKIWGDEKLCHLLMESNPQYLHKDVFEGGEELTIPQLPETQETPPAPWREE